MIEGRAIIAVDTLDWYPWQSSSDFSDGKNLHLFFLVYEKKDVVGEVLGHPAVIYVEIVHKNYACCTAVSYIGALLMRSSKYLESCVIPAQAFHNGLVRFVSFGLQWKAELEYEQEMTPTTISTISLRRALIRSYRGAPEVKCIHPAIFNPNNFILSTCSLTATLDRWALNCHLLRNGSISQRRMLLVHEVCFLYFHITLRHNRNYFLDAKSILTLLRNGVRIRCPVALTDEEISKFANNFTIEHRCLWNKIARDSDVFEEGEQSYLEQKEIFLHNLSVAQKFNEKVEQFRQSAYSHPMHASNIIDACFKEAIARAPTSLLNTDAVTAWTDYNLINLAEKTTADIFYGQSLNDVKAVMEDNVPLRLYGSAHVQGIKYRVCESSKLAMLTKILRGKNKKTDPIMECLNRAAAYTVPIWMTMAKRREKLKIIYHTCEPVVKEEDDLHDLDQILEFGILNGGVIGQPINSKSHECLNGGLHFSTIILDIDLECEESINVADVCRDAADLVNRIMQRIGFEVDHYFFYSGQQENKLGFHHHISLPKGIVFTKRAIQNTMTILQDLRYIYPKTIGAFCGRNNDKVYDPAIYSGKWHCLRSPYQHKPDGSNQLQLVWSNTTNTPPKHALFAHARRPAEPAYGRVILELKGVKSLADVEIQRRMEKVTIDGFVQDKAPRNAMVLMTRLNLKTILFASAFEKDNPAQYKHDLDLLMAIVTELWMKNGEENMKKTLANLDYPPEAILRNRGKVVLHRDGIFIKQNLCPIKNHSKPHEALLQIIYSHNMIRFGLLNRAFKTSCQNQYVQQPTLKMAKIFISDILQKRFQLITEARKIQVVEVKTKVDNNYCQIKQLSDKSLQLSRDIQYLYLLLPDLVAYRSRNSTLVLHTPNQCWYTNEGSSFFLSFISTGATPLPVKYHQSLSDVIRKTDGF